MITCHGCRNFTEPHRLQWRYVSIAGLGMQQRAFCAECYAESVRSAAKPDASPVPSGWRSILSAGAG